MQSVGVAAGAPACCEGSDDGSLVAPPPHVHPTTRWPLVQGTHTAMKSGMLAAEAAFDAMATAQAGRPLDLSAYETKLRSSWVS